MESSTLTTSDGFTLHMLKWPVADPRAVVMISHGIQEHIGRYAHVAEFLNTRGYAVYGHDHRGHGRSSGERGHFDDYQEPVEDMRLVEGQIRAEYPDKPIYLYGHSMGSLIGLLYVLRYQAGLAGYIVSGTPLAIERKVPKPVAEALLLVSRAMPKVRVFNLGLDPLSRDPAVIKDYETDPLNTNAALRMGMVAGIVRNARAILEQAQTITLPLLIVQGGADAVSEPEGAQMLYDQAGSGDKTLKLYPELYHEIHNEPEKAVVLADIAAWLDTHTTAPASR